MLAKLRKASKLLPSIHEQEEALRRTVLCLVAYSLGITRDALGAHQQPIAGWLLLRTAWHNTGYLAWLLHAPGNTSTRVKQFWDDYDIRAKTTLIDELTRILGQSGADALIANAGQDKRRIERKAQEAQSRVASGGPRSDWGNLRVDDLRKAIQVGVQEGGNRCSDPKARQELTKLIVQADIARTWGDDLAHPNPFAILDRLGLVDVHTATIRIGVDSVKLEEDWKLRVTCLSGLLLLQAAIIAGYCDEAIPLERIISVVNRHAQRSKNQCSPS
ncbi:MAG: hypothetical protein IH889_06180 [Planctomycetes bacterium]|nr:hypothetical protein [Planctomycetota bacterium]